ncbi:DUF1360 domain-containing protein [Bacillus salacetis]|uniref:DUF1360 domain-containing protein n=1 Tax=Bacillus salacetis TaxID=2315464 RepID=A0A3A1QSD1_9BACI|nr:DUF1360 domain-containing protein [Bacillus salacetis]RIW30202.1 DUF1360 domain-containing protein [Bacillus salacetis]
MELTLLQLIIMGLAVFRLTHLIVYDKITEFLRSPFFDEVEEKDERGKLEVYLVPKQTLIRGWIGELLSCYWCTGIWAAGGLYALFIFLPAVANPLLVILAAAGFASIIETVIQRWIS